LKVELIITLIKAKEAKENISFFYVIEEDLKSKIDFGGRNEYYRTIKKW
jgi:hypothetical protein